MIPETSPPTGDANEEISALIESLHETEQRLEELTACEVDTVADREGRTFVLRRAQEQLRHSEAARQGVILNALPAHIALLDTQGVIVSVNETWRRFVCANAIQGPGHGIGVNYLEMCDSAGGDDSSEAHQVAAGIRSVLGGRVKSFSIEYPCHVSTEQRWFLLTSTPLGEDRPNGAIVMHLDVTAERGAEERLRVTESRFRQMAENIHDVFFLQNLDGAEIYYVTPAYERIWGRTCESLYAHPASWADSIHPDDVAHAFTKFTEGRNTGFDYEFRIVRPDGEMRWIHVRGFPILDDAGHPYRTAGVASDITQRKQAEQELRESRQRLDGIVTSAMDAIVTVDEGQRIVLSNPAAERMFGYAAAELQGQTLDLLIPERFRTEHSAHIAAFGNAGVTSRRMGALRPVRGVRKNGEEFPIEASISKDESTGRRFFTAILRDVTERKQAADELLESERRFSDMLENVELVSLMLDTKARVTYCNDYLLRLTGWRREEVIGRDWFELFVPDDRSSVKDVFSAQLANLPAASHHVNEILTRSGGRRLIQWNNTVLRSAAGQVIGTASIGDDITHRKEAEAALRESEERFRATFEQAAVGMAHSGMDGRWLRVNQRCCDILGYTRAELLARTFIDVTHPDERALDHEQIRRFRAGEIRALSREKRFVHKNGSDVWVNVTVSLVRDPVEQADYLLAVLQDITARKQLEQELLHSQRMEGVGQLAGGIAHDFNNLLTVIGGRSQLALAKLQPADPLRHDLDLISKTANRAAVLTRQLLAFSRKQVIQPRVVDPNDVVGNATNLLKRLLGEDIELVFVPASDLGRVRVDPGQFEQVIVNLAVNARDAMAGGGRLTIETSNVELDAGYAGRHVGLIPGPYVRLTVSDTGIGMDAATRARIFEPFFTTKGPGKGTGLGLATVYGIVRRSEGHIRVYSEPGVGTVFKIYLPRTDAAPDAQPPDDTTPSRGTETILLVEDEAEVRTLAREVLESLGYTLMEATNATEAVLIAERHVGLIDLLLTDVVMPRMSGGALAEVVTAARPETKILFMSGYTDDAIVRHGVLEAGVQLLEKPFTPKTLAAKVRAALDRR